MLLLHFGDLTGVVIDMHDLDTDEFTPTWKLDERYRKLYPEMEIWHVVGGDLVACGNAGQSEIQLAWEKGEELWLTLKFFIIIRPGITLLPEDLPSFSEVIEIENLVGSSTLVRTLIADGKEVRPLLNPEVYEYILINGLYRKKEDEGC